MGDLYRCFRAVQKQTAPEIYTEQMKSVRLMHHGRHYRVIYTQARANKRTTIHCINRTLEWEQRPIIPRAVGRWGHYLRRPIANFTPDPQEITIVVIRGKPYVITGLDEGIFRSVHRFDEQMINVMSEARFREL